MNNTVEPTAPIVEVPTTPVVIIPTAPESIVTDPVEEIVIINQQPAPLKPQSDPFLPQVVADFIEWVDRQGLNTTNETTLEEVTRDSTN